jgi:hypothetical protein
MFFLQQHWELTNQLIEDSERRWIKNNGGVINSVDSPVKGGQKHNYGAESQYQSEDGDIQDIDESGRITKVKMPKKPQSKINIGAKIIGDY